MPVLWQGLDTMTDLPPFFGRECVVTFCTQFMPCKECQDHLDATEVEESLADDGWGCPICRHIAWFPAATGMTRNCAGCGNVYTP